jgi:RNA polymerase sigma-70 factor, ECF subfamily
MQKYSSHSDAALLAMWREKNRAAGSELFDRHYESLTRFFSNKVPQPHHEDLAQESFLATLENIGHLDSPPEFRKYLLGIAHHKLSDHYRKCKRSRIRETDAQDLENLCTTDPKASPASQATENEERCILLEALRDISSNHRIVLELRYWEDLSTQEISAVLAIPLGTAKTRLRSSQRYLRKRLAKLLR